MESFGKFLAESGDWLVAHPVVMWPALIIFGLLAAAPLVAAIARLVNAFKGK